MITVSIELPPSSNHRLLPIKGRQIKAPAYRNWLDRAACSIAAQLPRDHAPLKGALFSLVGVIFPDKRKRDIDNILKPVNDALVKGGAIHDDSLLTWQAVCKLGISKKAAKVEIIILTEQDQGAGAIKALMSALNERMHGGDLVD